MSHTDVPTIDDLLSMSKKQLEEAGYERTRFGVRKIVTSVLDDTNNPAELDLSANSILKRACGSVRMKDINTHFDLGEQSLVTIDKIRKNEAILSNTHMADTICISGTDIRGNRLEVILHIQYYLKNNSSIDIFHWRYKKDLIATSLSFKEVIVHEKITKSRLAKICNTKRPTQKIIQECLKNELANHLAFEHNGIYYWNGSKNNL